MSEILWNLDVYLFELINSEMANSFFDFLLPIWRNKLSWIPFYVVLLGWLIIKYKLRSSLIIGMLVLSVGVADTVSSKVIKPSVERLRPCNIAPNIPALDVVSRVDCGSGYSFPSSHATNHFAIAMFLIVSGILATKFWVLALVFWAGLIGYSQIYVGVHFPIDVVIGSVLGSFIGIVMAKLWITFDSKVKIWN